ncbi:zinc-dependent alcohol dehydrogenase family protein [Dyella sp. A6]|uniref:zinc-dependent alcohol dehydrogenase family protein n=1 Tax=Dyella aluminiiresistens TaxID=3069105 RepID=UPI002E7629E1|nr:zinc-dependent alcohol dehydrogenase family protein [Dyella sp. A6]
MPKEVPGPGEIRLRVRAIGINRTEITLRSGRSPNKPTLPTKIGFEAAGEVDALGPGVDGLTIGDRVAVLPTYGAADYGFYGDYALAPQRSVVAIPGSVEFTTAAAMWVPFGTAWAGLIQHGRIASGQQVLITAASSSVGLAAIQIARHEGARVIAVTRSPGKARALREHGANEVVVLEQQRLDKTVSELTGGAGVDLVFDPVGGADFSALTELTAAGGTLVLYGALGQGPATLSPFAVLGRALTIRGLSLTRMTRNDQQRAELIRYVTDGFARGLFKTTIAKTFKFDDIAAAHRYVEAGGQVGKVVVTV